MSDIPVRLRPRAVVPSGWPADVAPNQVITAAHINAIRSSVYAWPGDVDGQGHTLSNVHLAGATGVLADPTTTAGDLIARGAAALGRLPIGTDGQVLTVDAAAPAKLKWATSATAPVLSVFGRLGAVVAQAGDYTAAQVTGAVIDALTTKGDIFARGAATGRFPAGADGQVLRADASQTFGLRWSGESVPSVFGRTGAIAAQAGDYTAAQVTNAVSVLGAYPDPAWLTSLAWTKLIGAPATFPPAAHTHDAAAIVSGVLATARLGTGVADATVYLRGDGIWAAAGTGGGGGVTSVFGRAGTVVAQTGDYTAAQVTGAVVNPTTIKGDLMVRNDLNSIVRLPVGASGQVLQADSSLTVGMKWTNLTAAVQTPWVTDIDAANFQLISVRRLGVAIALPAYEIDVTGDINYTGTLRKNGVAVAFGGSQTPWTSDINAAGFKLNSAGAIGIGMVPTAPISMHSGTDRNMYITSGAFVPGVAVQSVNDGGTANVSLEFRAHPVVIDTESGTMPTGVFSGVFSMPRMLIFQRDTSIISTNSNGPLVLVNPDSTVGNLASILFATQGSNGNIYGNAQIAAQFMATRSAGYCPTDLTFHTNGGGGPAERMRITSAGQVGIGKTPGYPLDVAGDINCTGAFRVNGTPIGASDGTVYVAYATAAVTVSGTRADIPGATVTLTRAGRYLITGIFDVNRSSGAPDTDVMVWGSLVAGGTLQSGEARLGTIGGAGGGGATGIDGTVAQQWVYVATAGQVAKLQAYKAGGSGTSAVASPHTSISAIWVSST